MKIQQPRVQSAFTLVELLVCIAIIAVIAALLLPALTHAKQHAQRIQCAGNLHQLGIGLQVVVANDHAYPMLFEQTNGWWTERIAYDGLGETRAVTNFILHGVWRCPSPTLWLHPDTNSLQITYGYNSDGIIQEQIATNGLGLGGHPDTDTPIKESEIMTPADMIAIGDVFVQNLTCSVSQFMALPLQLINVIKAEPTWSFATGTLNRRRCNFFLPTPATPP